MLRIVEIGSLRPEDRRVLAHRGLKGVREVLADVQRIVDDVRQRGDAALAAYTKQFDKVETESFRVSAAAINSAESELDGTVVKALKEAADHIRRFQELLLPKSMEASLVPGRPTWRVGVNSVPLASAGAYVPGGRAAYPSSVLMCAIPAKVAKVKRVVVCTPPGPDGKIPAAVRYAAKLAEVDELYAVGGAQAIAAMAYGTAQIARVEKIVGPGNVYVTAAKKIVSEEVSIDFLAGPSEVMVVSDGRSGADLAASELIAQAEHDPAAVCVVVTTDADWGRQVNTELESQLADLPRRAIAEEALRKNGRIYTASSGQEAIDFINDFAAEHVMLLGQDPRALFEKITCAGSVFIGDYASVAMGDYCAGTNHVIPSGGEARRFNPLSSAAFVRQIPYTTVTDRGARHLGEIAATIARAEGLEGHARTAERRMSR
ncbi:MAG: histidinol dehydrogenase [Planctomycetes bacterium]|nr:histidinol dehydrogenase [Planctomycetota bacterium]